MHMYFNNQVDISQLQVTVSQSVEVDRKYDWSGHNTEHQLLYDRKELLLLGRKANGSEVGIQILTGFLFKYQENGANNEKEILLFI